jgi:fumarate reductase flavoprotein subunit
MNKQVADYGKADLVVIGSGGGGLSAAAAAVENGLKNIVVVEKQPMAGGNAKFAAGIFGVETNAQRKQGIDAKCDTIFRLQMDWTHWRVNPRIVRAFVDKSPETIQWLEDKGIVLTHIPRFHTNQLYPTAHQLDPHAGTEKHGRGAGALIMQTLEKECADAGVKFLFETTAKKILTDSEGKVSGVLVETKEGEKKISTGAVIIATSSKDGPDLAMGAGGVDEAGGPPTASGPEFKTSRGDPRKIATQVAAMCRQPHTLWVNKRGERFVDENLPLEQLSGNALQRQPEGVCFSLFDENIKTAIHKRGTIKSGIMAPPGDKLTSLEKDIELEVPVGGIKISNSWDEIADWMGVSRVVLKSTVDEYNSFCYCGHDKLFVKDQRYLIPLDKPPFYAAKCIVVIGWPIGGIKINHHMQVMNKKDEPVPGLYASGNDCGSWQYDTYYMEISAAAMGFAVNSGRIAGENAVKFIRG